MPGSDHPAQVFRRHTVMIYVTRLSRLEVVTGGAHSRGNLARAFKVAVNLFVAALIGHSCAIKCIRVAPSGCVNLLGLGGVRSIAHAYSAECARRRDSALIWNAFTMPHFGASTKVSATPASKNIGTPCRLTVRGVDFARMGPRTSQTPDHAPREVMPPRSQVNLWGGGFDVPLRPWE